MPSSGHQASGRATKFPCSSYSDGLNSGMGSPDLASRSLRSPSAADLIPSATSASASRNSIEPLAGPWLSSAAAQRRRPGNDAAGSGVQQRGHLLLQGRRRASRSHVHPGQQPPPRPAQPEPVPQRVIGNAGGQRLAAGDHVKLLDETPVEGIVIQPG